MDYFLKNIQKLILTFVIITARGYVYHFCQVVLFVYRRSAPYPLELVWKILVVRPSPKGPQFARSIGTLLPA